MEKLDFYRLTNSNGEFQFNMLYRRVLYLLILGIFVNLPVQVATAASVDVDLGQSPYYYYANDKHIYLTKDPDKFAIRFRKGLDKKTIDGLIAQHDFASIPWPDSLPMAEEYRILKFNQALPDFAKKQRGQAMTRRSDVECMAPVYHMQNGGGAVYFFGEVIIRFHDEVDQVDIATFLQSLNLEFVKSSSYIPNQIICRVPKSFQLDALEAANTCYESPLTRWAHPNFVSQKKKLATVNDPLYGDQWHLHNTGQGGGVADADPDIPEAWDITMGDSTTRISIQDDAVQKGHEDLQPNYVDGWDFRDHDNNPSPRRNDENHGTSVAGVAVGRGNNGIGISGAAPDCSLIGIRWGLSEWDDADMFHWSNDHGAAIISNSWGYTSGVVPDVVRTAIDYVAISGRDGKGCIVLFAAGNGNSTILSTSLAAMDNVIAVGASTNLDLRAYYSNYGPELDIMAPSSGGTLWITTTDRTGRKGYSTTNYTDAYNEFTGFGGTSSATPLVAGICGLILSFEPNLTRDQVQSLLQSTADKVGPFTYVNGRNDYYGYGRINAYAALSALIANIESIQLQTGGSISIIWPSVPLLNYRVVWSTDMQTWQDIGSSVPADPGGFTVWTDTNTAAFDMKFYKITLLP